jgi:uncharacterized Rmd1/YagE family protein
MKPNRFVGLKTAKTLQSSVEAAKPEVTIKTQQKGIDKQETDIQSNDNNIETRRRGRPNGKRSNENFRQVTAYINRETYKQTKMKLLAADESQEFSELIDELLVRWLREN